MYTTVFPLLLKKRKNNFIFLFPDVSDISIFKVESKSSQSGGIFHATPAHTSQQLHGPVYIQDQTRRGTTGMTFQQEERRRQELRRQEEAKQEEFRRQQEIQESQRFEELRRKEEFRLLEEKRRQEEMRRQEEGERKRQEEMRRQEEEERKRQEDLRRREEEQRRRQEEESRRRQEEKRRIEEERARQDAERRRIEELRKKEAEEIEFRRQEELKRQEIIRYEALKMEEEAKRQEEMRLEQEMRRKYEMQQQAIYEKQQQMEQQRIEQEQLLQHQQNQESIKVRAHIPKLSKNKSIDCSQDRINEALRGGEHLGKVKTGQVNEKRNFWIRSTSADRMGSQTLSPAPRRRRMDGWNTKQKENEDPESRPGSSLGAPGTGSVKNITSGFLSKSKSSAAVMQEEERGRPRHRAIPANSWTKEKYDEQTNQTFLKSQEVKTNKVNETITSWGKQDQTISGRTTPVPSRHIGQVFAENKVAKMENEKSANSWRIKTPEPSVKLVNVCVEKGLGSTQNIHISSNAHSQMSNLMQESKVQSFSQKQEMVTSSSMATSSMSSSYSAGSGSQPPPTPERNQSFGGKCPDTKPELEPKRDPKPCHETKRSHLVPRDGNETKPKSNQDSSVKSYSNKFSTLESSVSRQDMVQNYLQSSNSTQSINSVLSNCSSGAIPLPVKNSWFDDLENISVSSSFSNMQSLQSPVQDTPVPVTAHWFNNSDLENKKQTNPVRASNNAVFQVQDPVPQAHNPAHEAHNSAPQAHNIAFHTHNSAPQPHNLASQAQSPAPKAHNSASHVHNPASQVHNPASQTHNPAPQTHNPASQAHNPASQTHNAAPQTHNPASQAHKPVPQTHNPASQAHKPVPQTHNPAPQGQAKVFTKSVCSSEDLKISSIEDFDNKSVRSDTTVIENRVSERTIIKPENPTTPEQSNDLTSVISVPQSPSEIRKKFQQNTSFEKSFQKSAEFELSKEFREGVRGKVKESRESFLKRSNSDKFEQTKEMRELELQAVKLHRSDSRNFEHSSLDKSEILRQEKLQELEDVKRSRSRSRMREEENGENSYSQTKMEREAELLSLYNRRIEAVEDECLFSPTELKEIQLREERERELTELLNRQTLQEPEYTSAQKEKQMKLDRNLELIALTDRCSELDSQLISREEILRQERAEELRQISLLRNINSNEEDTRERGLATKTPELEVSEDTRSRVKETAAVWQHRDKREKSGSEDRFTPTPSRRIGSMFRREPEYWGEDEDLPAPPPEDVSNPPPPPRQSSRGKVEEYRTWSGGWKGRGSSSPAHPKLH